MEAAAKVGPAGILSQVKIDMVKIKTLAA